MLVGIRRVVSEYRVSPFNRDIRQPSHRRYRKDRLRSLSSWKFQRISHHQCDDGDVWIYFRSDDFRLSSPSSDTGDQQTLWPNPLRIGDFFDHRPLLILGFSDTLNLDRGCSLWGTKRAGQSLPGDCVANDPSDRTFYRFRHPSGNETSRSQYRKMEVVDPDLYHVFFPTRRSGKQCLCLEQSRQLDVFRRNWIPSWRDFLEHLQANQKCQFERLIRFLRRQRDRFSFRSKCIHPARHGRDP